jgi:hypothetical protein
VLNASPAVCRRQVFKNSTQTKRKKVVDCGVAKGIAPDNYRTYTDVPGSTLARRPSHDLAKEPAQEFLNAGAHCRWKYTATDKPDYKYGLTTSVPDPVDPSLIGLLSGSVILNYGSSDTDL